MTLEKVITLPQEKWRAAARFALLLGVAVAAPFCHNQLITGSLVNATLFLAASLLGVEGAILIAWLPSLAALAVGTLPLVLAPLIPFIILSNILLILVFSFGSRGDNSRYWFRVLAAASLKFIFLISVSALIINLLHQKTLVGLALTMMGWPQLATALAGGVLAYLILKVGHFSR